MKSLLFSLVPAFAILAAGLLVLRHQRDEITALERKTPAGKLSPVPGTAARLKAPSATSGAAGDKSPAPARISSDARAAAFIDKFREQARPLIDKTDRERLQRRARHKADRTSLLLGLSAAETDALRSFLEKHTGSGQTAAAREWILQNLGEEEAQKYDAAEAAARTATVEHDAQEAIFRLSRIVDLTPDQKDRLYTAFVRKGAAALEAEPAPSELVFSFSLRDTPSIANPAELARTLLTKEQLALFDASRTQEAKAISDSTGEVMNKLIPTMLSALQEAGKQ
jgi:hypothetical protein